MAVTTLFLLTSKLCVSVYSLKTCNKRRSDRIVVFSFLELYLSWSRVQNRLCCKDFLIGNQRKSIRFRQQVFWEGLCTYVFFVSGFCCHYILLFSFQVLQNRFYFVSVICQLKVLQSCTVSKRTRYSCEMWLKTINLLKRRGRVSFDQFHVIMYYSYFGTG